jgi:HEAT repeat protein
MQELAEYSAARFENPDQRRPAFLEVTTAEAEKLARQVELVRVFDGPITGRVLLAPSLVQFEQLPAELSTFATPLDSPENWASTVDEACHCAVRTGSDERWQSIRVPDMRLQGIDFRLHDPRGLYPGEDRVSFVFVDCPRLPSLDGRLVLVTERKQCQEYESELVRVADWYLSTPSIHLRYFLEEWSDLLLAWVKYFFIPDLHYWRYEDLNQYDVYSRIFEDLAANGGAAYARQSIFEYLLERFDEEADKWGQDINNMADDLNGRLAVQIGSGDGEPTLRAPGPSVDGRIAAAYAKLFSSKRERARAAAKELVGYGSAAFPAVARALRERALRPCWDDLLYGLGDLQDAASQLAGELVRHFRTCRTPEAVSSFTDRMMACVCLAKMGVGAHPHVLEWMRTVTQEEWEEFRSFTLGFMSPDQARAFLATALGDDDEAIRVRACEYIQERCYEKGPKSVEPLIPALIEQSCGASERLRNALAKTLADIGPAVVGSICEMIDAPQCDMRLVGLEALARYVTALGFVAETLADRDVLLLVKDKFNDDLPAVRVAAAAAFQRIAIVLTNQVLAVELQEGSPAIQVQVARSHLDCALTYREQGSLLASLRSAVKASASELHTTRRIAAVDLALARRNHGSSLLRVREGLSDPADPWRFEYLEAARMAGPRAGMLLPAVLKCLDAEPDLQLSALRALPVIGRQDDEAIGRVIGCLASQDARVRGQAANLLGAIGGGRMEAVTALVQALSDQDFSVRTQACEAIPMLGEVANAAVPALAALADTSTSAVESLGRIGSEEARTEVERVYRSWHVWEGDDDSECVEAARWLRAWGLLPNPQPDTGDRDTTNND